MKHLPLYRSACQICVILLFCLLPWLQACEFTGLKGSLYAFDAFGFPFADPASAAQAGLAGMWQGESPLLFFFAGALVTLGVAFLLGRVFCGWLCPYGFFSNLVSRRAYRPGKPPKKEFLFKTLLLLGCLVCASVFAYPLISLLSMPGQISLLPQLIWSNAGWYALLALVAIPLAALAVEIISGRRLWCRYACPQSVFLGLAAAAKPAKAPGLCITWNSQACTCGKNSPCRTVCKLGLNPRHKNGPSRRDCSMCGDCVSKCSQMGKALKFSFSANKKPGLGRASEQ